MAAFAAIHGAYPLGREGRYMDEEFLLLDSGSVPVNEAMDEPLVSHRSADFEAAYERVRDVPNCVER